MTNGEDFALRQSQFERLLDALDADNSPPAGALVGAERLWPRASGPIGGRYCRAGAVARFYDEGQETPKSGGPKSEAPEPAALPQPPASSRLKMNLLEINAELAVTKDLNKLRQLRRRFAFAAHPDRVGPRERPLAEKLMAEVNAAIDGAISTRKLATRKH
jgi:hypothetical protein